MKKWISVVLITVAAAVAVSIRSCRNLENGDAYIETVTVQRGDLQRVQRETGLLESRDATPVRSAAEGSLEWVIRDGEWVEPGDKLFVINVDEALVEVTQKRTEVLGYQQELSLEHTRRRHAERVENQKVQAAQRALELATIRHRILSTAPVGGRRLIEIHEQLQPLEAKTSELRDRYERSQTPYQQAQDAYLEALDDVQEKKDRIVYYEAKADEYTVRLETRQEAETEDAAGAGTPVASDLAEAKAAVKRLESELPPLEKELALKREARERARAPRDELFAALAEREADQKELYIQLEIEKRGIDRVQLELDHEMALLRKHEADRKEEEGRLALAAGAISHAQLDKLQDTRRTIENELKILDEKLAIARRPEPEEVLTEARMQMEQAEVRAQKASDLRDRALRTIDQKIRVLEARIAKSTYDVERAMRAFPEVLEFSIEFLKEEREALDDSPEGTARRAEIDARLLQLEADLVDARKTPPNVALSPLAGVVRLMTSWGRPMQTGDDIDAESIVMQVYPGTNLEVRAYLNEADVGTISDGDKAHVLVPALGHRRFAATVTHASRVGKDKFDGRGGDAWAGVTQFELRVRLDEVDADLRPGMTAIVVCVADTAADVLHLPRAAVRRDATGYYCLKQERGAIEACRLQGRPFSGTAFIVEAGLAAGDEVIIRRRRSS